jgi:hypothetical protein
MLKADVEAGRGAGGGSVQDARPEADPEGMPDAGQRVLADAGLRGE